MNGQTFFEPALRQQGCGAGQTAAGAGNPEQNSELAGFSQNSLQKEKKEGAENKPLIILL